VCGLSCWRYACGGQWYVERPHPPTPPRVRSLVLHAVTAARGGTFSFLPATVLFMLFCGFLSVIIAWVLLVIQVTKYTQGGHRVAHA
jgi:hypothetical protein